MGGRGLQSLIALPVPLMHVEDKLLGEFFFEEKTPYLHWSGAGLELHITAS